MIINAFLLIVVQIATLMLATILGLLMMELVEIENTMNVYSKEKIHVFSLIQVVQKLDLFELMEQMIVNTHPIVYPIYKNALRFVFTKF